MRESRSEGLGQREGDVRAHRILVVVDGVRPQLLELLEIRIQQVADAEADGEVLAAQADALPQIEVQVDTGALHQVRLAGTAARGDAVNQS